MKVSLIFIILSLVFIVSPSWAVTVSGLYEAVVPVTDQSTASQNQGIRAALLQVMVKLTGQRNATSIYGVDTILDNANSHLQQYEFRTYPDEETGEVRHKLWVSFDANGIRNEVRQHSIPIWSQERPSTLIWMVINDELGQRFAKLDRASRYLYILNEQASARGISFVTPLLDVQDTMSLKDDDVVAGLIGPVQQASSRYVADAILTVVVNNLGPGIWQAEWMSIINDAPGRWQTSGSTAGEAISEGVDALADTLASIYRQDIGYAHESTFEIIVSGIPDFRAYAKTLRYLESLNFINQVDVKRANDNSITYSLVANGGFSSLEKAVLLGSLLQSHGDGQTFSYNQ